MQIAQRNCWNMEKINENGEVVKVKKTPSQEITPAKPKKQKTLAEKMQEASELRGHSCRYCGKFKPYAEFKVTTNPYVDRDGYMSICSKCLTNMLNDLSKTFENLNDAFYTWCQNVDMVYDADCITTAVDMYKNHNSNHETLVTKYWRAISLNYKNKPIRYRDSRTDNMISDSIQAAVTPADKKRDMREKWGEFKEDEYKFLENKYNEYTDAFGVNGPNERDGYKTLAILLLRQRTSPENKDITAAIKAQYEMLGIDPKQLRKENKDKGGRTLGLEIAIMEQTDPADYYDRPEMYFDHDGLEKDLKDLIRAQKNHLTGSRDFQSFDISTEIIDNTQNDEPLED